MSPRIAVALIAILLLICSGKTKADNNAPPDHPNPDGLVLWLDASNAASITADAKGQVQKWTASLPKEQAGAMEDHIQKAYEFTSDPASSPQLVPGAIYWRPAVHFSGAQLLKALVPIRAASGPISVFVVARRAADPGDSTQAAAQPLVTSGDGNPPPFSLTTDDGTGKPGETAIYYGESFSVPIGPLVLGQNNNAKTPFFNGDIAEVLVYDRPFLSAGERQPIEYYLHAKWNAVVPLAPGEWTRVGDLGTLPTRTRDDLPLSDQDNKGNWVLDPKFSDDFKETSLDLDRWHLAPTAPEDWRGRPPALFMPSNVTVSDGMLHVTDRKGDVPEMAKYPGQGFAGYTTGFVDTRERSGYGYYEIKARPMSSAFCSAFWLTDTGLTDNGTEIDIFEMGAKAPGHEHEDNMTAHVWGTPQDKRHWAVGSSWKAPWLLRDDFHIYGFEWNKDELRWYVDGVLVHKLKNTNWQFPMKIVFDSEPMWQWFGKVNDADLPSSFDIQYLKVWKQQTP